MVNGQEIIIGMKRDVIFGQVILFGLGGVFVEVLKDVSLRIAPLIIKDCRDMINEIKGKKILYGFRNIPKTNQLAIIDLLLKTSKLAINEKNIAELDFNPVMVDKKAVVVDARIIENVY
jgi:acyl-CoA synthetase (NDP forming)